MEINQQCSLNKTFIIHTGYLEYLNCLPKWLKEGKIKWLSVSLMPQEVWAHFGRIWLNFGTSQSLNKPICSSHSVKMQNWKNILTLSKTLKSMEVAWQIFLMPSNSYNKDWHCYPKKLQLLLFSSRMVRILSMEKTNLKNRCKSCMAVKGETSHFYV